MNNVHDMGGMQNFGPVVPEVDEPVFHHAWERRIFAVTLAMGAAGRWNIDTMRSRREGLPPALYLSSPYYRIWLEALEGLLVETGLVTERELRSGKSDGPDPNARALDDADVERLFTNGWPSHRQLAAPPRFSVGQAVRTRMMNPRGHTRLPHYCRDKAGVVEIVHGGHVLPDSNALRRGENPEHLYTIRFDARELWGEGHNGLERLRRLLESYLSDGGHDGV